MFFFRNFINSKLFVSFGVYFGSSILNALLPFLLLPFFTKYLSVIDYGYITIFSTISSFLFPFIGFSTGGVISREYFNGNYRRFSEYSGNVFFVLLVSSIPVLMLLYIVSDEIVSSFNIPASIIPLAFIYSFFTFFTYVSLSIWQVRISPFSYGFFQVGNTLINLIFSILLVGVLNFGWEGRVYSQTYVQVIFGISGFLFHIKSGSIIFRIDKNMILDALKFGVPLIPHSLGAVIMIFSDRFIITKFLGVESVGLYSLGYTIGSIIGFIENSFNLAFAPWLFEKLNKNSLMINQKIVKFTYLYFVVILFLSFLLFLVTPYLFTLFINPKFHDAQKYVFWFSLSFAFSGMYKMVVNYIFFVKKTKILAYITFFSSILNFSLSFYLVRCIGAIGAAYSSAFCAFIFFVFAWVYSSKVYKMPWHLKYIFRPAIESV